MTTRIALLRGVNLGARNKVAMPQLREVCETLGFANVETYINSGNVIFGSDNDAAALEAALAATFELNVPVVVLTADDLDAIIANNPYPEADAQPKQVHVGVLSALPQADAVPALLDRPTGADEWRLIGRALYLRYRDQSHNSPLAKIPFERYLGVRVTARNWATIRALKQRCAGRD